MKQDYFYMMEEVFGTEELIKKILLYLPIKDIELTSATCKLWRGIVSSHQFWLEKATYAGMPVLLLNQWTQVLDEAMKHSKDIWNECQLMFKQMMHHIEVKQWYSPILTFLTVRDPRRIKDVFSVSSEDWIHWINQEFSKNIKMFKRIKRGGREETMLTIYLSTWLRYTFIVENGKLCLEARHETSFEEGRQKVKISIYRCRLQNHHD